MLVVKSWVLKADYLVQQKNPFLLFQGEAPERKTSWWIFCANYQALGAMYSLIINISKRLQEALLQA